jgi:hypothetical protein
MTETEDGKIKRLFSEIVALAPAESSAGSNSAKKVASEFYQIFWGEFCDPRSRAWDTARWNEAFQ